MSNPVGQKLREFTVQIRHDASDAIVGTGIVVAPDGTVATCKHVVRDAVAAGGVALGAIVRVRYTGPSHAGRATTRAHVTALFPGSDDDVVLLAPLDAALTLTADQVAVLGCPELDGTPHVFKSFGYRRLDRYQAGIAAGVILGDVPAPDDGTYLRDPVQLRAEGGTINSGMSGSGVLDTELNLVVGLVSAVWNPDETGHDRDTGWAVDARVLSLDPLQLPVRSTALPLEPAAVPRDIGLEVPKPTAARLRLSLQGSPVVGAFVGRRELLDSIANDFAGAAVRVTSLMGLGGSGKSYLARHAVQQLIDAPNGPKPDAVFWWSFNKAASVDAFMEALVSFLSEEKIKPELLTSSSARAQVIGAMLGSGRYLIVLDNMEAQQQTSPDEYGLVQSPALAELLTYLASPTHSSHTIVTSRVPLHDLTNFTTHTERVVGALAHAESVELLRALGMREGDDFLAREAEERSNIPLALRYAAQLSRGTPVRGLPALADGEATSVGVEDPIARMFAQYDAVLPAVDRALMMTMSVFRGVVPHSTLAHVFGPVWEERALPEGFNALQPASIDAVLARLEAMGLCEIDRVHDSIEMHRLARSHYAAALRAQPAVHTEIQLRTAISFMTSYLNLPAPPPTVAAFVAEIEEARKREDEVMATETIAQLQPVIEAIHHSVQGGAGDQAWILFRVYLQRSSRAYLWSRLGAYDTALATLISLFPNGDLTQKPVVSSHITSTVLNTTAFSLGHAGRVRESLPLYERALDACDPADHESAVRLLLNLVDAHLDLGESKIAANYLGQAMAYAAHVEDKETLEDFEVAKADFEDYRGETDSATAIYALLHADVKENELHRFVRFSFMEHLIRIGNLQAARAIAEFAIRVYSAVDRRPDLARAKGILGAIAMQSGAAAEALTLLREAAALAEAAGDFRLRLDATIALALVEARYGDADAAGSAVDVALRMARQSELRPREMQALIASGWLHVRRGNRGEASRLAAIVSEQSVAMDYAEGVTQAAELAASASS
ncbi:MAG TPA: trypsin-like peptidase domain-containing protein [Gemmatimonadaceae bacterium]|jgi:tetratricopeptide (TPR) repeat protein